MKREIPCRLVRFGDISATAWDEGAIPSRGLMQSYPWLAAAAATHGAGDDTPALVYGSTDAPRAVALLGRAGRGAYRLLGNVDTGECVEVIAADNTALDGLARGLVALGAALDFGHYPTRSGLARRLRVASGWRGVVLERALGDHGMPVLPLGPSWRDPLAKFGRSRRQGLRRKERRAEKMGGVAIEIGTPTEDEAAACVDRFIAIEAKNWKGRAGSALRDDAPMAAFFHDFGRRMAARGCLRPAFLTVGGEDAAAELAAVWDNRFWSIKLGYDDRFAPVSPGELLRIALVAHAAEAGFDAFEFCGKDAAWSRVWTEDALEIAALRYYPLSLGGLAAVLGDGTAFASRRWSAWRRRSE